MWRIAIVVDPSLSPPYPEARPVVVEVELNDGQLLVARKQIPAGDFSGNPIPSSDIVSKFKELVEPNLGNERPAKLSDLVQSTATCPDARAVIAITGL